MRDIASSVALGFTYAVRSAQAIAIVFAVLVFASGIPGAGGESGSLLIAGLLLVAVLLVEALLRGVKRLGERLERSGRECPAGPGGNDGS